MKMYNVSSLAVGAALGVAFSIVFDNFVLGMAIGIALGATGIFYSRKIKS